MSEELERRITELEAQVATLAAREAILATFNRYLYSLDTSFGDAILDAFSRDATLDVLNFPPDGVDMHFKGRDEMASLYAPYAARESQIAGGHNASNISIAVDEGATTASLTAYFTTTRSQGVQGGRYEGRLLLEPDGRWRFVHLAIISAWGWTAAVDPVSQSVPVARSEFGGQPATGL